MSQMFPSYSLMWPFVQSESHLAVAKKKCFGNLARTLKSESFINPPFLFTMFFWFWVIGWGRSRCWSCWKTWSLLPGLNNWTAGMVGRGVGWKILPPNTCKAARNVDIFTLKKWKEKSFPKHHLCQCRVKLRFPGLKENSNQSLLRASVSFYLQSFVLTSYFRDARSMEYLPTPGLQRPF